MKLLATFVRSMGVRRGVRAWWIATGLRGEARLRARAAANAPIIHHGERPSLPGWRR